MTISWYWASVCGDKNNLCMLAHIMLPSNEGVLVTKSCHRRLYRDCVMNDMTRLIPELDKLMQRVEDLKVGETERLEAQRESLMRMFTSVINRDYTPDDVNPSEVFTSEFYEAVHQKEPGYQRNNWFSKKYVDLLSDFNFQNIFELGSGNGQATLALSAIANRVTACDFNDNPYAHLENVTFHKASFFDLPTNISASLKIYYVFLKLGIIFF